jgi:hypothetical protein
MGKRALMSQDPEELERIVRQQLADIKSADGKPFGVRLKDLNPKALDKLRGQIVEYSTTAEASRLYELRAEECRTIADGSNVPEVKINYEDMARHYDQMANFSRRARSK